MTPADNNDQPERPEPVIRDKRRIDPETGSVRQGGAQAGPGVPENQAEPADPQKGAAGPGSSQARADAPDAGAQPTGPQGEAPLPQDSAALADAAAALAAERLTDLQRLQAEYVNYRKRVERDRALARESAIGEVVEALMPVLDEIALARQHGDLVDGSPFAAMSDKVEAALGRFGLQRYGEPGEEFDPTVHEALMHQTSAEATSTQISMVMQPGYKLGERVLRAARVGVTSPE